MKEISCFISSHGFGHATRAIGVLENLYFIFPKLHVHIFTTVPKSLFSETLSNFTYHPLLVDIGFIQSSALSIDLDATEKALDEFIPFSKPLITKLSQLCKNSELILCDIAPLGIAVGVQTNIPSLLIENFTWDWMYQPYQQHEKLASCQRYLQTIFQQATYHIQTVPLCNPTRCDLTSAPIYRKKRGLRQTIRKSICSSSQKIVLITLGGIDSEFGLWPRLEIFKELVFVFSGQKQSRRIGENIVLLDKHNSFYHPDLIDSSDLVVCKAGYSTLAECYQSRSKVLSVGRDDFMETKPLLDFVTHTLKGHTINQQQFEKGDWLDNVAEILESAPVTETVQDGGAQVAQFVANL